MTRVHTCNSHRLRYLRGRGDKELPQSKYLCNTCEVISMYSDKGKCLVWAFPTALLIIIIPHIAYIVIH